MQTRLDLYDNSEYNPGAGVVKRLSWFAINALFLQNPINLSSGIKVGLLRLFGAKVGHKVTIKPSVNIKYPWLLEIGNHVWIGEEVWIDNLIKVKIGNHVCISQGAMLLTGSHNYKVSTFDLITNEINLENGVWIGAKSVVCPGVTCHENSVLAVGSVATKHMEKNGIYQGNPAILKRQRVFN
ncbi:MAG TPA: colanic acid biosynthesis acetyltransferase WcaF [Cytophagales bacterium]|nr:colanic acid biosynthesis acetyltransferase WcaF [Cytophagales bacterium]